MLGGGIAADGKRAVQAEDGRNHDDVPGALPAHDGQRGLRHGHLAEKVGLELPADLVEPEVFGKSGNGKASIVDEDVEASVVADNSIDKARDGVEVGDIQLTNVDARRLRLL